MTHLGQGIMTNTTLDTLSNNLIVAKQTTPSLLPPEEILYSILCFLISIKTIISLAAVATLHIIHLNGDCIKV